MTRSELAPDVTACIEECRRCQLICLNLVTGHCLEKGGGHIEPEHVRAMLICAWVCGLAADVMATGSTLHRQICAVCADTCDACITSCRDLDDMEDCIAACERCKNSCEGMTSK